MLEFLLKILGIWYLILQVRDKQLDIKKKKLEMKKELEVKKKKRK